MAIIDSQLISQTDRTITIQFTARGKDYSLTVIKHPDYTVDELVQRWTNRAKREFMTNPMMFQRMFIDRMNRRHEKIVSGEIAITTAE